MILMEEGDEEEDDVDDRHHLSQHDWPYFPNDASPCFAFVSLQIVMFMIMIMIIMMIMYDKYTSTRDFYNP